MIVAIHLHHSNPRKEEKELLSLWLSSFFIYSKKSILIKTSNTSIIYTEIKSNRIKASIDNMIFYKNI